MTKSLMEFKLATKHYLSSLDIGSLRSYGRNVGVFNPTTKKKAELVEDIVGVLSGEIPPVQRSNLGAPVKSAYVDPKIEEEIAGLQRLYLEEKPVYEDPWKEFMGIVEEEPIKQRLKNFKDGPQNVLVLEDPEADEIRAYEKKRELRRGQLETLNGVSVLLPLDYRTDNYDKIVMPIVLINKYDLREGDIVGCYAIKQNASWVATEILTVNDLLYDSFTRFRFDEEEASCSSRRIKLYEKNRFTSATVKYFDWLIPLGHGQRGCVLGAPKTGKTSTLLNVVQSAASLNEGVITLVLLIDQPPETVSTYRKVTQTGELVFTTYEDDPERQVFAAEFLLRRAKRIVECGLNVLLVIDSFTALARAYNDTDASAGGKVLAGGLESKTLQYLKKYFGSARYFGRKGSLTILGSVSTDTGNPMDDIIGAEMAAMSNLEIRLSEETAAKHIYPAIDLTGTSVKQSDLLQSEEEVELDFAIRNEFLPKYDIQELNAVLGQSDDYYTFKKNVLSALNRKK